MNNDHLERIIEITENNENLKESDSRAEPTEKMSNMIRDGNINTNDLSLLKEFIMSSLNNNNSIQIQVNDDTNDERLNKPPATERLSTSKRKKNKIPSWGKVTFKDSKLPLDKKNSDIVSKYRHLFEDVEEPNTINNPKSGRAHYGSFRKNVIKDNDMDSDFTSFRHNGNNTQVITDISLDKINTNFKVHNELIQDGCLVNTGSKSFIHNDQSPTPKTKDYMIRSSLFHKEKELFKAASPSPIDSTTTRNE